MREFTLRICGPEDDRAVRAIAERDSAGVPSGPLLCAEIEGELVAAISLADCRVIADPFRPTTDAVNLLRRRADQVRDTERGSSRLPRFLRILRLCQAACSEPR